MIKIRLTDGRVVQTPGIHEKCYENTIKSYCNNEKQVVTYGTLDNYMELIKSPYKVDNYISTGIESLDEAMAGGLRPGLYVIGANPGLGKSSLTFHIMINLARNKQHSVLFNLEMSDIQVVTRLLANTSYRLSNAEDVEVDKMVINDLLNKSTVIKDGKFTESYKKLVIWYKENINPYINILSRSEDPKIGYVETIETTLRNYSTCIGITPVVVIDFLQLIQSEPIIEDDYTDMKKQDKRLDINEVIDKLKQYSNIYQVPVIIITSISRAAYTKESKNDNDTEYSMGFGKESGNIEYQADFLALLTRGKTKSKFGEEDKNTVIVNILKSRSSSRYEKIPLEFIPEYSYFQESTKE